MSGVFFCCLFEGKFLTLFRNKENIMYTHKLAEVQHGHIDRFATQRFEKETSAYELKCLSCGCEFDRMSTTVLKLSTSKTPEILGCPECGAEVELYY